MTTITILFGLSITLLSLNVNGAASSGNNVTLIQKTLCAMPITDGQEDWSRMASHAFFATTYYQQEFPSIQWSAKYVNVPPGSSADMARGWVINGTTCDALVGPGFSTRATTISPIVDVPWVDVSTSTELSDKTNHPTFSRSIPTSAVVTKAVGIVFKQFGWNRTHILCTDETYHRSVANGVATAVKSVGATVDISQCLERTTSRERVIAVIERLYASSTRIVYVVLNGGVYDLFEEECLKRNCTKDFIFFFADGRCPFSLPNWPGALCANYLVDSSSMNDFLQEYYARNLTEERRQLAELGWPIDTDITTTGVFAQFAHDAARHVMSALHEYYTTGNTSDVITFVREHTSQGATGLIQLDANGDRADVDMEVFNNNLTGSWNTVAIVKKETLSFTELGTRTVSSSRPDLILLDQLVTAQDTIPSGEAPDEDPEVQIIVVGTSSKTIGLFVGIGAAALLVLVMLVWFIVHTYHGSQTKRDVRAAPKDEKLPFTMVFTDIQSSTNLWSRIPEVMTEAVDQHHTLVRALIERHNGYEVKTIGDSFMVAFNNPEDAIRFSTNLQNDFFNHDWGHDHHLDLVYKDLAEEQLAENEQSLLTSLNPLQSSTLTRSAGSMNSRNSKLSSRKHADFDDDPSLWNGLRVRVAINYGVGEIKWDALASGYDYYGTVVNTASRVEGVGHGGQVLMTAAVFEAVVAGAAEVEEGDRSNNADTGFPISDVALKCLGPQILRGLDEPVVLYQILPTTLERRAFNALRLTQEHHYNNDDTESSLGSQATSGSESHHFTPELMAQRFSRRGGCYQHSYDNIVWSYYVTKAMFSTVNDKKKIETLELFAKKWGLSLKRFNPRVPSKVQYERNLMELVLRVTPSVEAKQDEKGRVSPGAESFHGIGAPQSSNKVSPMPTPKFLSTAGSERHLPILAEGPSNAQQEENCENMVSSIHDDSPQNQSLTMAMPSSSSCVTTASIIDQKTGLVMKGAKSNSTITAVSTSGITNITGGESSRSSGAEEEAKRRDLDDVEAFDTM